MTSDVQPSVVAKADRGVSLIQDKHDDKEKKWLPLGWGGSKSKMEV